MTDDVNPYAPPESFEALPSFARLDEVSRQKRVRDGAIFWWCYFAICCFMYAANFLTWAHLAAKYGYWDILVSRLGLSALVQTLSLIGLLCYIRKVPLLHPTLWGVVFLSLIGISIYAPFMFLRSSDLDELNFFTVQTLIFVGIFCLQLPQLYALWRYSSPSSRIWKAPRIQWNRYGRRLWDAIQSLRRV